MTFFILWWQGFTKEFGSLSSLITHHSVMSELLPCPLSLHQYQPQKTNLRISRTNSSDFMEPEKLLVGTFTDFWFTTIHNIPPPANNNPHLLWLVFNKCYTTTNFNETKNVNQAACTEQLTSESKEMIDFLSVPLVFNRNIEEIQI